MGRKRRPTRSTVAEKVDAGWGVTAMLFAAALAVRLLFWRATPDASWPYGAGYKGDALLWLEWASALRAGQPFQLGLPVHPPGTAYVLALLWDGASSSLAFVRGAWAVMGALTVALVHRALRPGFGAPVAAIASLVAAGSTSLLLLGNSIAVETPYLLLVVGSFVLLGPLAERPRPLGAAGWGALQGAACLFRVEHVAFALAAGAWLGFRGCRGRPGAWMLAAFLLVLAPWHAAAWRAIERFNAGPRPAGAAEEAALRSVEAATAHLSWQPEARRRVDELPAFARRHAAAFVAATLAHRGARDVRAADVDGVLRGAFGAVPQPLPRRPFVSLYGGLNFALANGPRGGAGFSPDALAEPPPLRPAATAYPAHLVGGLPPPQLSFLYPPHVLLVTDGWTIGLVEIAARPATFVRRVGERLLGFGSGAATGITGFGLPTGLSGRRRAVDVLVAEGPLATVWRLLLLAGCGAGLLAGKRNPALVPWLLFAASKALAAALFFGYARLGATVVPVTALLLALACVRYGRVATVSPRAVALAAAVLVAVEAVRCVAAPSIRVDGRPGPVPPGDHREHVVEFRSAR